jgi:hypothetical protein
MTADVYPLQVLLLTLAGRGNRHQQQVIEYLVEGNRGPQAAAEGAPSGSPMTSADASPRRVADSVDGSCGRSQRS